MGAWSWVSTSDVNASQAHLGHLRLGVRSDTLVRSREPWICDMPRWVATGPDSARVCGKHDVGSEQRGEPSFFSAAFWTNRGHRRRMV